MMPTNAGRVYWVTGLSGAGKTTLAVALVAALRSRGRSAILLDGDQLREILDAQSGHGREARFALAMRYARLCKILSEQGSDVVIATISMFREVYAWNRRHLPDYVEIYLKVPLDELRRRDPKGIYRRADAGGQQDVAGLDLSVEPPESPDILIEHQDGSTPASVLAAVLSRLGFP
jgi:adenylylsulfate kinase